MPGYDFRTLSPTDFELLVRDLLRAKLNIEFEAFAHGPDGGVDLRATVGSHQTVVQCKHYAGSTFSQLKSSAVLEKVKMDHLSPNKYYFVTTQNLTLTQKEKLREVLSPHVKDTNQILAQIDLNQLLGDYPGVESEHFKLWMASAQVIKRIVDSGVWVRRDFLLEEIQDRVKLYVATESFAIAEKMLQDSHVCVITGAPGVGKSMLADMLALQRWHSNWQVITLASHEIDRCWDAWSDEQRQLFHFDDVFGQTDISERLSRDSGQTIARLITKIGKSKNKELVITTRTHILKEAEMRDESLERADLQARECVVQVEQYTKLHRARVLYNHLYFSNLRREQVQEFVRSSSHIEVINHPNFTPRLIEQSILQRASHPSQTLLERMIAALDRPVLLWEPSFRESLNETSRKILMQLVSFQVWGADHELLRQSALGDSTPLDYTASLRTLEGSWIRIANDATSTTTRISFQDPSCRDFILTYLDSESDYAVDALRNSVSIGQVAIMLKYALAGRETVKYPGIRAAIGKNVPLISEIIRSHDLTRSQSGTKNDFETLYILMEANETFKFGLDNWIVGQIFWQGSRISNTAGFDADTMREICNFLVDSGKKPSTETDFDACYLIFFSWCEAIYEQDHWTFAFAFAEWAQTFGDAKLGMISVSQQLRNIFGEWVDLEIDAVLDNAENSEDGSSWVDEIKSCSISLFGEVLFPAKFDHYEERALDKWDDANMSSYDYRAESESAKAIERTSQASSLFQHLERESTLEVSPRDREANEIREMFNQLA